MKALFLDRDGVVNIDKNYVHKITDFEFIPEIFELCRHANQIGYKIFIITNQAGIAKGYYTVKSFMQLTNWMLSIFKKENCCIEKVYYCPFHEDATIPKYQKKSFFRKPNPGMILKAKSRYNLDLENSVLIGDQKTDIQAGINAGIKKNLYLSQNLESVKTQDLQFYIRNLSQAKSYL